MELEAIHAKNSPTRCPYCHESVSLNDEDWYACQSCLGRHHSACWVQHGHCSSCSSEDYFEKAASKVERKTPPDLSKLNQTKAPDSKVLQLLDANENTTRKNNIHYILSHVSLMLYPILQSEHRLREHARQNEKVSEKQYFHFKESTDPRESRLYKYYRGTTKDVISNSLSRAFLTSCVFAGSLIFFLLGLLVANSNMFGYDSDEIGAMMAIFSGIIWYVTVLSHLFRFHNSVQRHDSNQLSLNVLEQNLTEDETRQSLSRHKEDFAKTNRTLVTGTVLTSLIGAPFFFPLWIAGAFQMSLDLHEKREAEEDRLFRPHSPD